MQSRMLTPTPNNPDARAEAYRLYRDRQAAEVQSPMGYLIEAACIAVAVLGLVVLIGKVWA